MWYKFCKQYDTAIAAIWFDKKDIDRIKIKCNWKYFKEKTQSDEFHLTLMYLGDLSDIKDKKDIISKITKTLSEKYKSLELTIGGVARFFSDDASPVVLTVNEPKVEKLRGDLLTAMDSIGIVEPEDSPSFLPHVTLGYSDDIDLNKIDVKNNTIKPKYLAVSWGGDLIKFDLN